MYRHRKPTAWLAILAMALHALAPSLAQATPRGSGLLVPVCSSSGIVHYLELPAGKAPPAHRPGVERQHCSLCLFGAASMAPPPAGAGPVPSAPTSSGVVAADDPDGSSSPSYPPAQARAPPVLS